MNPRPPGYEPDELPDCSTPRYEVVERAGFEPAKASASRFTVCPLWPLGYLSTIGQLELAMGLEPKTC